MNHATTRRIFLFLCILAAAALWTMSGPNAASGRTAGPPQTGDDKTLSPYFFVKGDDASVDALPLKATSAKVAISGTIADVLVTQVYKNEGKKTLEAIYIFPASTRAAVYAMRMTIGSRVIEAQIAKREDARKTYEQAKKQGKSASLLEEQRPNVFRMDVANILPGDEIKVEMRYTELLVPAQGVYEFVYPTVVGPRYSNKPSETASPSDKWVENPYLHAGEAPPYTFGIETSIAAGMPIKEITCSSHKVDVRYEGPALARINLDKAETRGGNKDYILRYRLQGERIESGLLLFEGEKENFFLFTASRPSG
jgi:Ca-activated chloride channel family protein